MRVVLIVNPVATSTTSKRRRRVEHALAGRYQLEVVETEHRNHATTLARSAADQGVEVVAVLAGDGTLNEAANGLVGSTTALAPLPGGSTNVFARSLGFHHRLERAGTQFLAALDARSFRRVGLGSANGRRFLFHLGVGFDAAVIASVERHPWWKHRLAHPSFAVASAYTFLRSYDRREPTYRISIPDPQGAPHNRDAGFYAIVSNTTPYAFFGPRPLTVSPYAGLDRALALTTFRRFTLGVLLTAATSALATGARLERIDTITQLGDLHQLTFEAVGSTFPWQVDGDYLGESERLDIRYEPDALTLVVP